LDQTGMFERVCARIKRRQFEAVEIVDYAPRHRKRFKELNVEWLRKHFTVESIDKKILDDPEGQILKPGGQILFARLDGKVVGTAALLRHTDGEYELAKMAVTETAQGRQVGKRLALTAIDRARTAGARNVILYTSPLLVAANELYRQLGFEPIAPDARRASSYRRPTIVMRLELNKKSKPKQHRRRT
jgi:ribosomal protein S18 acetylase RimI-like enzyme